MTRIAHLTANLCRGSAGLGKAVQEHSSLTKTLGYDTKVFGFSSRNWEIEDKFGWAGAPVDTFQTIRLSGPFGYAPGYLQSILEYEPNIVHLHGLWTYASITALRAAQSLKSSLIISPHGMLYPTSLSYKPMRKKLARLVYQDRVLRNASLLHATATQEQKVFRDLGLQNATSTIPLGVGMEAKRKAKPRSNRRALFLGRIHHQKGIDWLIEAWLQIEQEFSDWELAIAGPEDPDYSREFDRLKTLGKKSRISFLGPINGEQKWRTLSESDVLVLPSRSENFGLVAVEAMMMEVPVLTTEGTPWSELVSRDAGWYVRLGQTGITEGLRHALSTSKEELRRKGENARVWVEECFASDVVSRKWDEVYKSLA